MRRSGYLALGVVFLALAGCGDGLKRVSIQGKVTAGGKPLDNATLQFIPTGSTKGEGGIGRSDGEGKFTLTGSRAGAKGIVPGDYKVRISRLIARDGSALPADAKEAENPGARESVPPPYSSVEGTPLTVTVPESGGEVTIAIPTRALDR
jgi:hypothetical protein